MNPFDASIIHFINGFTRISPLFDTLIVTIMSNDLVKGGFIMASFWYVWFRKVDEDLQKKHRKIIVCTILGSLLGVLIVRGIEHITTPIIRPIINPQIQFKIPYGISDNLLAIWRESWYNSNPFPSDHAALFYGFAVGFLLISRSMGMFILFYVLFIITFPRVYVGVHYPSDIIVGGLIGGFMTYLFNLSYLRDRVTKPFLLWYQKSPATFYPCFFLFSFEVANLFSGVRQLGKFFIGVF